MGGRGHVSPFLLMCIYLCHEVVYLLASQAIFVEEATVDIVECTFAGTGLEGAIEGSATFYCKPGFVLNHTAGRAPECVTCPVGRYSSAVFPMPPCGECSSCPAGMYSTKAQAISLADGCKSCPAGQYQEAKTAGSDSPCKDCPEGRYGQFPGEVNRSCTGQCPLSLQCAAGTASPKFPLVGHYSPDLSQKQLEKCPTGKYKATLDFEACSECPNGYYTPTDGSAFCMAKQPCVPGTYDRSNGTTVGHERCVGCPSAYYQPGTNAHACIACEQCTSGARQKCSKSFEGFCIDCAPGRYFYQTTSICIDCPDGRYQPGTNEPSCLECGPCGVGNREGCGKATAGFCSECYPGRYSDAEKKICSDCPAQYFQIATDQQNCSRCPDGKYQNAAGNVYCTDTPSGMALRPKIDGTTGEAMQDAEGSPLMERVVCPAGKFSSASSARCEQCEQGKVQPESGKAQCEQCSSKEYIKTNETTGQPDGRTCVPCPGIGFECDGEERRYVGGYWHSEAIINPDASTNVYTCPTDGCPDAGATQMRCNNGYLGGSALCAVCADRHFRQARKCVSCQGPHVGVLLLLLLVVLLLLWAMYMAYKHRKYLGKDSSKRTLKKIFAHLKILISYFTVQSTISVQFGVKWPASFYKMLDVLSFLSLDLSVIGSLTCLVDMSFDRSLYAVTLMLLAVVVAILTSSWCLSGAVKQISRETSFHTPGGAEALTTEVSDWSAALFRKSVFVATYVLIFGYPIVASKVVKAFGCHGVNGVLYLRVDYSILCDSSEWRAMAVYAGFWLALYVIAFPVLLLRSLWKHGEESNVSFLMDDYNIWMPVLLWECCEMVRKLLISVIGACFTGDSAMNIATALMLSTAFLLLHQTYEPFKTLACNRLQSFALSVQTLIYFIGLLLKTRTVGPGDAEQLGYLMATMVVAVFLLTALAIGFELRTGLRCMRGGKEEQSTFQKHQNAVSSARREEPLTKLLNKRALDDDIKEILPTECVCIINIDLTALGFCNDALGHEGANDVIVIFADAIKEAVDTWHSNGSRPNKESTVYRQGGDEYAVICYPTSHETLERLVGRLADINWSGDGTEGKHRGVRCHSWLRIGAVCKVGATVAEADRLEAEVKSNLKAAGAKLAKGKPAPSLSEVRELPSKPLNYLVDYSDAAPRGSGFRTKESFTTNPMLEGEAAPVDAAPLELQDLVSSQASIKTEV